MPARGRRVKSADIRAVLSEDPDAIFGVRPSELDAVPTFILGLHERAPHKWSYTSFAQGDGPWSPTTLGTTLLPSEIVTAEAARKFFADRMAETDRMVARARMAAALVRRLGDIGVQAEATPTGVLVTGVSELMDVLGGAK